MQGAPEHETAAFPDYRIAAIVPCFNEEAAVEKVVRDLRRDVPGIEVYVYDNNSTDNTAAVAARAGAYVRRETEPGKGNVVRRAFADVEADLYLLIDGDDTYDTACAPDLIRTLIAGPYDHVLGVRSKIVGSAYRPGHELGNRFFNGITGFVFERPVSDMLSGYRAFSRRFVKSFPALSREFEIETELTIHATHNRVPQTEVDIAFRDRAAGSESKLRTYHDGMRILRVLAQLLAHERPLFVNGIVALSLLFVGLGLGAPVVVEYLQTGLVPRLPTAVLAMGLVLLAGVFGLIGAVLNAVAKSRRETSRLFYLQLQGPRHDSTWQR